MKLPRILELVSCAGEIGRSHNSQVLGHAFNLNQVQVEVGMWYGSRELRLKNGSHVLYGKPDTPHLGG